MQYGQDYSDMCSLPFSQVGLYSQYPYSAGTQQFNFGYEQSVIQPMYLQQHMHNYTNLLNTPSPLHPYFTPQSDGQTYQLAGKQLEENSNVAPGLSEDEK